MVIRPAVETDVPSITRLVAQHAQLGDVLPRDEPAIRASLADWLVAELDGEVAACVSLLSYRSDLAEVRSLVVADAAKGRGLGSALVHALAVEANRRNIPRLFALTRSVPFFKRAGFDVTVKDDFPEKVWQDCNLCPVRDHCDETAMVLWLDDVPHLGNS